jgi:4-aminobutyrate--pyruvate transaminase
VQIVRQSGPNRRKAAAHPKRLTRAAVRSRLEQPARQITVPARREKEFGSEGIVTDKPNSYGARDAKVSLHPYTNARTIEAEGPIVIERGKGVYVYDDQGKEYIEALAGLWSVGVGFSEERLVAAATEQLRKLPYYHNFMGRSHPPSIEVAQRLVELSPDRLKRVFFSNSGSEANDTVVKLVWYYNNAIGRPKKKKIISRIRAFHGVTVASASLTGLPLNHADFDLPLPNILHTANPHHYRFAEADESEEEFASRLAGQLEAMILREGPDTVAAFIGEPIMAAGGVIVPPRTYWRKIQAVCRKYDMLVIADEVITGFGRTGNMFACETFGIDPDILVVSKQLTSSYQPLAAVLFSDQIYQGVADNSAKLGGFGHGFTTGGHPVATAVALENLKIIEERDLVGNVRRVGPRLQEGLRKFIDHPIVGEVRGVGLIAAVEIVTDKKTKASFNPPGSGGTYLFNRCIEHGLLVRNSADAVSFCPPMIIDAAQIDEILVRFGKALDDTQRWLQQGAAKIEPIASRLGQRR